MLPIRLLRSTEAQGGVHGKPEEGLPAVVKVPAPVVPPVPGQRVAGVEETHKRDLPELGNSEHCGRFHFHHQAAFFTTAADPGRRLAVYAVGGPGLAEHMGHTVIAKEGCRRAHRLRVGLHLPIRGQVMV